MTLKESTQIVQLLHDAYPQDKKATTRELSQRAISYQVAFADYPFEIIQKAAQYCIMTNKWYPTTKELLDAAARARLTSADVSPITTAEPITDKATEEYLEAFCKWIGFGFEEDDTQDLPKGVTPYEI